MTNLIFLLFALQMPLHHMSNGCITLYYPAVISDSTASTYFSLIRELYVDDTAKFGIDCDGELRVRLCRDAFEFSDLTRRDSAFSPLWKDRTLYVLVQESVDDITYKSELNAGVIRALLDKIHVNGAPWWLINSVAMYESGEYTNCPSPVIANVDYFSDLEEKIQMASSPEEMSNLCFYLGETGKFFELRFGVGSLMRLIDAFKRPGDFNDVIKMLFHVNRGQLENDWRDFLIKEIESK
jgi:hypothetical protein